MENHVKFETPGTYTILEGQALKQHDPRIVTITGTFEAPSEWVQKRKSVIDPNTAHVIFDYPQEQIIFTENETSQFPTSIIGRLFRHSFLRGLNINSLVHSYTPTDLYKILRFQSRYFVDKHEHLRLMQKLVNFSVRVTSELEKMDDRKGNTTASKIVQLQGKNDDSLNLDFALTLPLIEGTEPETLLIHTEFEVINGNNVQIYLICHDLEERLEALKEKLFSEQFPIFTDFVTILKK